MISHKLTFSLTNFWEILTYTEAALEANDDTKALAKPVTRHIAGFKPLHEEELEAGRQRRKIEALVAVANLALDHSLTTLHKELLGEVKQDRESAAFVRLFADPLSEQVRFGLAQQLEVNREALRQLEGADSLYSKPFVKAQAAQLKAAIKSGEAALAARQQHEIKQADLRLRLEDWKQDANTVLTAVESALNNHAAERKLGKKWPKTFLL